jgi:hypothetical protein
MAASERQGGVGWLVRRLLELVVVVWHRARGCSGADLCAAEPNLGLATGSAGPGCVPTAASGRHP